MINDLGKAYKRDFLKAEFLISVVVSVLIVGAMKYTWSSETIGYWLSTNKKDIYPLIATIGGTLLGFVITGVSIILAFSESEKLRLLKRSKQYETIFTIYFSTVRYLAITTVVAIFGMIIDDRLSIGIFYLLIWSVIISSLRIWRCLWVLENIVEIMHKTDRDMR